jgi:hypothetical protein
MEMAVKHHLPKGVRLVAAAGVLAPEAVICTPPTVIMRNIVSKVFTPLNRTLAPIYVPLIILLIGQHYCLLYLVLYLVLHLLFLHHLQSLNIYNKF